MPKYDDDSRYNSSFRWNNLPCNDVDGIRNLIYHIYFLNKKDWQKSSETIYDPDVEYHFQGKKVAVARGSYDVARMMKWITTIQPHNNVHIERMLHMGNDFVMQDTSEELDPVTGEWRAVHETLWWEIKDGRIYRLQAYRMDHNCLSDEWADMVDAMTKENWADIGDYGGKVNDAQLGREG